MQRSSLARIKITLKTKIALIIFGLFLFFVFLEVSLRLGGFLLLSIQEYRNLQSIKQKGAYRIVCLGESTTQRQYPQFLEQALNQRNMGLSFSVVDKGRGGTNTSAILSQVETYLDEYHPDMAVTMMGINDWWGYIPFEAAATSKGILFIRFFRTYKLARLLWLHILTKAKEVWFYKLNEDKHLFGKIQTSFRTIKLKKAYVESISPEDAFKKAIEFNPKDENAYIGLGRLYREQGRFPQAEDAFKKALELDPKNDRAHVELGWFYWDQGKFPQAEDAFKKALELNPKNDSAYVELTWFYLDQGKFSQAEGLLKKAIELNPRSDRPYGAISVLYEEIGKPELAKEYSKKVNRLRLDYAPVTVSNYRKLKEILDKRGIRLVCVQYPMRNVEPLKRIFEKNEGVIFVDNESVFKEALKKASYKDYFRDMFGGDFGHCTEKGNRLLAQNIADTILRDIFGK